MFYTKYKNTHSQNICGTGYSIYSGINNGVTNKLGMTDTTPSTANVSNMLVNFLGIEGCWGYVYEFIEGIHSYSGDDVVIAYDKVDLYNGSKDYHEYDSPCSYLESTFHLPTLRRLNSSYISGYTKDIWGGEYGDMTIKEETGSSSLYYCDYGLVNPSYISTYIFMRSCDNDNSTGGVSYLGGYWGSNDSGSEWGSRLAFDGTIVETSVDDFKGITNWRK